MAPGRSDVGKARERVAAAARWGPLPWLLVVLVTAALAVVIVVQRSTASDRDKATQKLSASRDALARKTAQLQETQNDLRSARAELRRLRFALAAPTRALLHNRQFQIAFIRGSYPHGLAIFVAALDGRESLLVRVRGGVADFAWARRGAAALLHTRQSPYRFELVRDGELQALDADERCISSPDPAVDGTRVECGDSGGWTLHVPGRRDRVVPDIEENISHADPALSRDGKWLASVDWANTDPAPYGVGIGGTRCRRCGGSTSAPEELWAKRNLSWSPDGKRLAFSALRNLDPLWRSMSDVLHGAREAVIVVDTRGRVLTRIPNAANPAWSPDGKHIAFDSDRSGHRQIYVADSDGANVRQLTHAERASWNPRWR